MKPKKTTAFTCGIGIAAVFAVLLCMEIILRIAGYHRVDVPFTWFHNAGLFTVDSVLIYRTRPLRNREDIKEFTNILGMKVHSREDMQIHKSEHSLVVLGDSFVWGDTASESDTYPRQLQEMLNKAHIPVTVYNAGVSGYGTDQEYEYFIRYVLPHIKPDIVVWNMNTNDILDNIYTPLFDVRGGTLTHLPLWKNGIYIAARLSALLPEFVKRESRVWNVVLRMVEPIRLYAVNTRDHRQWSMKKVKIEIQNMRDLAAKNHFTLYIATDPSQCIVEKLPCASNQKEETNAIARLAGSGPDVIDQSEYLISSTASGELFLNQAGVVPKGWWHPNAGGNFLMAESVFKRLQQDGHDILSQQ